MNKIYFDLFGSRLVPSMPEEQLAVPFVRALCVHEQAAQLTIYERTRKPIAILHCVLFVCEPLNRHQGLLQAGYGVCMSLGHIDQGFPDLPFYP